MQLIDLSSPAAIIGKSFCSPEPHCKQSALVPQPEEKAYLFNDNFFRKKKGSGKKKNWQRLHEKAGSYDRYATL